MLNVLSYQTNQQSIATQYQTFNNFIFLFEDMGLGGQITFRAPALFSLFFLCVRDKQTREREKKLVKEGFRALITES